jgi:hypothetical protein
MTHEHSGSSEHVALPEDEHSAGEEDEARAVELVATEVLPEARVEELSRATTEFIRSENLSSLNAEAVTDLQTFESTGVLDTTGSQGPAIDPKRPPLQRTLARRDVFQRSAETMWPTKAVVDPATSAAAKTVAKRLTSFYETSAMKEKGGPDATRVQIVGEMATFGTSLDEYVKSRLPIDALDPACTDPIVVALREVGAAPKHVLAEIEQFTRALSGKDFDVATAAAAGRDLLRLLKNFEPGLEKSGRPIGETAKYFEFAFGLALEVGETLQRLAEGKPVTPRTQTAAAHDLSIRLRTVEAAPNSVRVEQLAAARKTSARTQDLITKATTRIAEATTALDALTHDDKVQKEKLASATTDELRAAIQAKLAQNTSEESKHNTDITNDQRDIANWQRRLTQQHAAVDALDKALASDAATGGKLKDSIASPGKGKKFTMWRDSLDQALSDLSKLGLDDDDLDGLKKTLRAVRDGVDAEFASQMKALADVASGATPASVLADGWAFVRRLSDVRAELRQVLKRPRAKGVEVEGAVRQLEMVLAALAGYLSDRVAVRNGLGVSSET